MAGIPIPDFGALANNQGNINQIAGNQQTLSNRPDQNNQYGSLSWTQGPNGQWTQNQQLNAGQQDVFNAATAGQSNLAREVGAGMDWTGMANWGNPEEMKAAAGFGASQQVIDAMKGLQNPGLQQSRDAERARLAAMGITLGSDASNTSERNLGNIQSDADMKAILAGTQEYGNVFNRQQTAFNDANALRQQQFNEKQGALQTSQAGLSALAGTKTNTNAPFAGFAGATALPPPNQYQAGLDTYNAQLAQQNADTAAKQGQQNGYAALGGQLLQGAGGISGVAGGIKTGYDFLRGLWSGTDSGGTDELGDFIANNGWS